MGIGKYIFSWAPIPEMKKLVESTVYTENLEMKKSQQLMFFEEGRGGKNVIYWVEYANRFGTLGHLANKEVLKLNSFFLYDLDIYCIFIAVFLCFKFMIKRTFFA